MNAPERNLSMIPEAPASSAASHAPLLRVRKLSMHFPLQSAGLWRRALGTVRSVDEVSFDLHAGETLALVGESGCGKTTTGRCVLRVLQPTAGEVLWQEGLAPPVNVAQMRPADLVAYRRQVRLVFQDPAASLNPRMTIRDIVGESLELEGRLTSKQIDTRVAELLRRVGLRPEVLHRHPHAFSGGERQRVSIARALAPNPRVVVADEALSALDVSVQAQTINLLLELQRELGLAYLFISHDLSVVYHLSDRVAVMYVGRIVEIGPVEQVFARPRHPYTAALLASAPVADPRARHRTVSIRLAGEVPDPAHLPSGCAFHPRCPHAVARCQSERPELQTTAEGHSVACHRADELRFLGS
jgi:peptide/nickel transport system ATP-binding protein